MAGRFGGNPGGNLGVGDEGNVFPPAGKPIIIADGAAQGVADAGDEFQGFHGHGTAHHPHDGPEHSGMGAGRHGAGERRGGERILVDGPVTCVEHGELRLVSEDGCPHVGNPQPGAAGRDHVANIGGVGAINHHIHISEQTFGFRPSEPAIMGKNAHLGVQVGQHLAGGFHLGAAHLAGGVNDLAVQVAHVHGVVINNGDGAHSRSSQVEEGRGAQTAGADTAHVGVGKPLLLVRSETGEAELAGIPGMVIRVRHLVHTHPLDAAIR